MVRQNPKIHKSSLLHTNLKYGLIGILVGVILCLISLAFNDEGLTLKSAIFNVLFSFFITLSIANIVRAVLKREYPSKVRFWKFVIIFYICNMMGMVLGIELSYLIISKLFDIQSDPFNHVDDYRSSSVIVMIVGTLILLYHLQKANSDASLAAKDKDLALLNQLKTQAELQALQSKINPHFLYNALNSIVSLIHEDPLKAEEMTMKLSKLFRYSLNSMHENFSTVSEEVEILNTYMEIEKVRFGDRIQFEIEVDKVLEERSIPRFLLQPLVENALKHGLKDMADGGKLKVVIKQIDKNLVLFVYDNGIPFPEGLISGYGLQSTYDKLQLLYQGAYELQMVNTPEKFIRISIPLT